MKVTSVVVASIDRDGSAYVGEQIGRNHAVEHNSWWHLCPAGSFLYPVNGRKCPKLVNYLKKKRKADYIKNNDKYAKTPRLLLPYYFKGMHKMKEYLKEQWRVFLNCEVKVLYACHSTTGMQTSSIYFAQAVSLGLMTTLTSLNTEYFWNAKENSWCVLL